MSNKIKRGAFLISLVILFSVSSFAQNGALGSWNILHLKYTVDEKWSLFGETQLRSLKFYDDFHYYEYKGGVNYKLYKNVNVSLGAGSYQTYREGGDFVLPKNNDEFRIWPQLVLFQSVGKLKIEQRYRSEFRYTSKGYRNRYRYRLGLSYPFGKEKNGFRPFQLSASDELFFTNKEPYFERNRLLLSFSYKPLPSVTLQMGYLYQFDYKINDETGRDFLVVGFYYEWSAKKKTLTVPETELKDN